MSRIFPLVLGVFVTACSGTVFKDSSHQRSGMSQAIDQTVVQPGAPTNPPAASNSSSGSPSTVVPVHRSHSSSPSTSTGSDGYRMPSGSAVIPVAIGGASLTCLPDPSTGVLCSEESAPGFIPAKAYYASEMEKIWLPTTFTKRDTKTYAVALPEDLKTSPLNVAIMMVNAENQSIADIEFSSPNVIENLVQNPSFEDFAMDPDYLSTSSNTLVGPDSQTHWRATRTGSAYLQECLANIEIENAMVTAAFPASHGRQFLELASRCTDSSTSRDAVHVFQALPLKKGHIYRVTYAFRKPYESASPMSLKVTFGNDTQRMHPVTSTEWVYASFVKGAESDSVNLGFEEIGTTVGRGTQIDHIMAVDITELENR